MIHQEPPVSGPLPSPEEMSGALREIVAGPDFASLPLPPRQRIFNWIGERLTDAWDWLRQFLFDEGTGLLEFLAIVVVLGALIALGAVALRRGPDWAGMARDKRNGGPDAVRPPASATEWFDLARARAGAGNLRPAASALYQGFLLTLDKRGTVAFHPSKTPGDYAVEMDADAGRSFIRHFQGLSFGHEAPTPAGYAALEEMARDAGCSTSAPREGPEPS